MNKEGENAAEPRHPIKVVARRTGLTTDVLRVWEKRYRAVTPARVSTGRRLYSDADVERLLLLRRATLVGRRIGQVAGLPTDELEALVITDEAAVAAAPRAAQPLATSPRPGDPHLDACLDAVSRFDAAALERSLSAAAVSFSTPELMDRLVVPLMRVVGGQWRDGTVRVAHEHLATAVVRTLLGRMRVSTGGENGAPELVVTTPSGQRHELGALMAAMTASALGWHVTYLGPDLPAEEIAAAAVAREARAVALSIIYPGDDPRVAEELRSLRSLLPGEVSIIAGGSGSEHCSDVLDELGALRLPDLDTLRRELESIRYKS